MYSLVYRSRGRTSQIRYKEKLNLDTTLQSERGKPRIYIVAGSMNRFRSLVATYFQEAMLYKLR